MSWLRWPGELPLPRSALASAVGVGVFFAAVSLVAMPRLHAMAGGSGRFGGLQSDGYIEIARSLASGHGYVFEEGGTAVMHRPPLYPVLLTGVAVLPADAQPVAVTLIQSALLAMAAWLLFSLAARTCGSRSAGIAVCLFAIYPFLHWQVRLPRLEILQTTLMLLLLHQLAGLSGIASSGHEATSRERSRVLRNGTGSGLAAGALALTHGAMLGTVALLFSAAAIWLLRNGSQRRLAGLFLAAVVCVACIVPWTLRNQAVSGRLVPVTTNAGFAYFLGKSVWGLYDRAKIPGPPPSGQSMRESARVALALGGIDPDTRQMLHFWGLRSPENDARMTQAAVADVVAAPERFLALVCLNGVDFFFPAVGSGWRESTEPLGQRLLDAPLELFRTVWFGGLFLLAGVALVVGLRDWTLRLALVTPIIACVAPYLPFFASRTGYSLATVPLMAILAGRGIAWLAGDARRSDT